MKCPATSAQVGRLAARALAAASGHDWLFLDNEHGAFSFNEIAQLCIASLPTGVTPLVRVCANALDDHEVQNVQRDRDITAEDLGKLTVVFVEGRASDHRPVWAVALLR